MAVDSCTGIFLDYWCPVHNILEDEIELMLISSRFF